MNYIPPLNADRIYKYYQGSTVFTSKHSLGFSCLGQSIYDGNPIALAQQRPAFY